MSKHVTGIDHVLVVVSDLASAAATWRRLGFTTTPRGSHAEWGTANHCLMFGRTYVELIAPVGAGDAADRLRRRLADRGEGLSAVAFGTGDAAAAGEALRRAGVAAGEPAALSRPMDDGVLRFATVALPAGATPGAESFLCQHLTPDLLRRDEWLHHANGARGLASLTLVVDDPFAAAPCYERLFGAGAATPTDNTVAVHTGEGLLLLCRPDELTQLHPEADLDPPPQPPAIIAATVAVADTDVTARLLDENGVAATRDTEGTIRVSPADANGVFLEFVAAS